MSMPIQRQSEMYAAFDDGLRFQREHRSRDLPDGLVNMLGGPRIQAGLNNTRQADLGDAWNTLKGLPSAVNSAGTVPATSSSANDFMSGAGKAWDALSGGVGTAFDQATSNTTQGTAVPEPAPPTTDKNAYRQSGFGAWPDSNNFAREDLQGHGYDDGEEHSPGFDPYGTDPQGPSPEDPYAGHDPSAVPEMPLDQMVEQHGSMAHHFPPEEPMPHEYMGAIQDDYDAQFSPHSSFSEARTRSGSGPASEKTAAPISPQVVPGWVGHGYAPGHRVGLPWRDQVIPGTVTHLDGQEVGVRWDDNQHSTEEPKDLRPL